jgi:hypothetical protein
MPTKRVWPPVVGICANAATIENILTLGLVHKQPYAQNNVVSIFIL